ncbi:hypothetical protein WS62_27285 [Burkholderia sp. ABCPW 14]|nr:hypothetical protein WS62_27285 [Burkholderia sp. ABCPW 14]
MGGHAGVVIERCGGRDARAGISSCGRHEARCVAAASHRVQGMRRRRFADACADEASRRYKKPPQETAASSCFPRHALTGDVKQCQIAPHSRTTSRHERMRVASFGYAWARYFIDWNESLP